MFNIAPRFCATMVSKRVAWFSLINNMPLTNGEFAQIAPVPLTTLLPIHWKADVALIRDRGCLREKSVNEVDFQCGMFQRFQRIEGKCQRMHQLNQHHEKSFSFLFASVVVTATTSLAPAGQWRKWRRGSSLPIVAVCVPIRRRFLCLPPIFRPQNSLFSAMLPCSRPPFRRQCCQ
jgi:hypothetical protein